MSLFDHTSQGSGRFGRLSANMFFIRNTAKPKRVRHIEGLNGALICNVNDDPALIRSQSTSIAGLNTNNLPTFETPRRVERLVPPTGFWNTHGIIHDTERWKQELASLATASGLGIEKDDSNQPRKPMPTADSQHASRSGAYYSTRTGRFNEGTSKSRGRTTSKHHTANADFLFRVPENEREMWMLQVLCQLLGTSNLEDVQSWLVSASATEKEQARTMIHSALRGLKESERVPDEGGEPVDFNALSNFVERQKHEEKQASQQYIKDSLARSAPTLQSIDEEIQTDVNNNDSSSTIADNKSTSNISLQTITTYRHAFPNYHQGLYKSMNGSSNLKTNENPHDLNESIDTIHLEDDRQRPPSGVTNKSKRTAKKSQSLVERSTVHSQSKHPVETLQFDDDNEGNPENNGREENLNKSLPSTQKDELDSRSRKIRHLQKKLSRQEEESKKLFDELQTKQSRLENAIKLLVKQTTSFGKRHSSTRENDNRDEKDSDAPIVNVIIQSPRETHGNAKTNKAHSSSNASDVSTSYNNNNKSKGASQHQQQLSGGKQGDYSIQDVKVQISLSRMDSRSPKVYSGVWKPDASTIQRLQGN